MTIRVLVRQKPDRKHLLLYYIDPDCGRERSKSAGTSDKREAERAAAIWEQELLQRRGSDGTGWDHFRQRFEDEHLATVAPKTRKCYATALNAFRKHVKIDRVSQLDASAISIFSAALLTDGFPITSVRTYLTHIRSALNWAKTVGLIYVAPKVSLPKIGRRKLSRSRAVTHAEYLAMRAKADEPDKRFLDLLWFSGLRLDEAMILSWDSPPIYVSMDAKPHPQIVYFGEGHKSGKDDATPIPPDFYAWLQKTPAGRRTGLVAPVDGTLSMVSTRLSGIGEAAGVIVSDVARRGRKSPVKYASAHDLRRAFGTRWALKVRPLTLKAMMRHETLETTMRFYIGLTGADAGAELWSGEDPQR